MLYLSYSLHIFLYDDFIPRIILRLKFVTREFYFLISEFIWLLHSSIVIAASGPLSTLSVAIFRMRGLSNVLILSFSVPAVRPEQVATRDN